MEDATEFKQPVWLKIFSWLFFLALIVTPIVLILGIFSGMSNVNIEIFGITLDGPEFGAFPKLALSTVVLLGGFVGHLILSGSASAFRVGIFYCYYSFALTGSFHFLKIGTGNQDLGVIVLQYSMLGLFALYLHLKLRRWESSEKRVA